MTPTTATELPEFGEYYVDVYALALVLQDFERTISISRAPGPYEYQRYFTATAYEMCHAQVTSAMKFKMPKKEVSQKYMQYTDESENKFILSNNISAIIDGLKNLLHDFKSDPMPVDVAYSAILRTVHQLSCAFDGRMTSNKIYSLEHT